MLFLFTLCLSVAGGKEEPNPMATSIDLLESRLMSAGSLELRAEIKATGAVDVDLKSRLCLGLSSDTVLSAEGHFMHQPFQNRLMAGEGGLRLDSPHHPSRAVEGASWKAALLIGLTRMGQLHNLANLHMDAGPDHAAGGVTDWVLLRDTVPAEKTGSSGRKQAIHMKIFVADQPSGEAWLWLDEAGLPVERLQRVEFASGSMEVLERYEWVVFHE